MKKHNNIETAARGTGEVQEKERFTIGIDVSDKTSCYCILDEDGRGDLRRRESALDAGGIAAAVRRDGASADSIGGRDTLAVDERVAAGVRTRGHRGESAQTAAADGER
jgi:hypothetical protein